jgi:uncharacterized protein
MQQDSARELFPDLARACALCGIALVNVTLFAYPGVTGYPVAALATPWDQAAWFLVAALFLYKSYTLFSFMFGVGFAQQQSAAQRSDASFGARYARRMLGLLLLGVANIALLFYGDILVIYAFFGTLLYLFRNASVERLIRWGRGLYVLQVVIAFSFALAMWSWATFAPEDMATEVAALQQDAAPSYAAFTSGDFMQVAAFRLASWQQDIVYALSLQGFGVIAFFLLGLAAARAGLLRDAGAPFWERSRRLFLPLGIAANLVGGWLLVSAESVLDPREMFGLAIIAAASPWSTAGYLGLIAAWVQAPDSSLRRFMARAGSASLTAYLLQGLLLSLLFCGYGLGLYGRVGAAGCVLLAALAALGSLAFCSLWRERHARGPVEALLRALTYLGPRPRG